METAAPPQRTDRDDAPGALEEIRFLMPVWGRRHVGQFLGYGLPSMLAPRNIPALATRHPCVFLVLTRERDVPQILEHPAWRALQEVCAAKLEPIDDLVSRSSSTVLTLAYLRAIRLQGQRALVTAFVFLVSDYIFADGALAHAVGLIEAGASGVLAGNFQMTVEGAGPPLERARSSGGTVLALEARQLMGLALRHLHPATLAAFADDRSRHDPSSNRLFWRAGERTIVGRFYLLHMIAIRPETTGFAVSAPSDYALIPELCPSGRIATITDSDDYLVVEMQPEAEPLPHWKAGSMTPQAVADAVGEWTTEQHRANVGETLVFRAGEPDLELAASAARSDAFVAEVASRLGRPAQPFRGHSYWAGALDHHLATAASPHAAAALAELLRPPAAASAAAPPVPGRLRSLLLGRTPDLRPWHPRWPDLRLVRRRLAEASPSAAVLIVSEAPHRLREVLVRTAREAGARTIECEGFDEAGLAAVGEAGAAPFDLCLFLAGGSLVGVDRAMSGIAARLAPGAHLLVSVGDLVAEEAAAFEPGEIGAERLRSPLFTVCRSEAVAAPSWRAKVQGTMMRLARTGMRQGGGAGLARLVPAAALAPLSLASNGALLTASAISGKRRCSSLLITLRRTGVGAEPAPSGDLGGARLARDAARLGEGAAI